MSPADGPRAADDLAESSLLEHLIELRARLLRAVVAIVIVLVALLPFARVLYDYVAAPLISNLPAAQAAKMIASEPTSGFFAPIKLAFCAAVFLTAPWLLYQAWAFVAPGLYRREKRLAVPLLASSVLLFYAGCLFAYFVVLPSVFHALAMFTPEVVTLAPDPGKYLDFVLVLFLAFGLVCAQLIALVLVPAWICVFGDPRRKQAASRPGEAERKAAKHAWLGNLLASVFRPVVRHRGVFGVVFAALIGGSAFMATKLNA